MKLEQESILPNIAQLVERLTVEDLRSYQAVTGSNPVVRSFFSFAAMNFQLSTSFLFLQSITPFCGGTLVVCIIGEDYSWDYGVLEIPALSLLFDKSFDDLRFYLLRLKLFYLKIYCSILYELHRKINLTF